MAVPHPIPYQGSKRRIAEAILAWLPPGADRLVEPFAGSAALSLAAAGRWPARRFLLSDVNGPLMALWDAILHRPDELARDYAALWASPQGRARERYDEVRAEFNRTRRPACLLYLLARCVKAAVRYNRNGEFNQSPDNRRRGATPECMARHIRAASALLRGRTALAAGDFRETLRQATPSDFVYLDPPYQGVSSPRDARYFAGVHVSDLAEALADLNRRGLAYALSYDGRCGKRSYGCELPDHLRLTRVEIRAGRSSQATLLGRDAQTVESLYLSPALLAARPAADRRMSPRAAGHTVLSGVV